MSDNRLYYHGLPLLPSFNFCYPCKLMPMSFNICQRNTYQAVLVTNGKESFAIFNYNNISWTTASSNGGDFWGLGGSPGQVYWLK